MSAGTTTPPLTAALVIVHLSSLDSFAFHEGMAKATRLARNIAAEILSHRGPVIIVDQGWTLEDDSAPRARLLETIAARPDIHWIRFDEDVEDWAPFIVRLRRELHRRRVTEVIVGGIWYDPRLETGCATEVYLRLRRFFDVTVNPALVGCAGPGFRTGA